MDTDLSSNLESSTSDRQTPALSEALSHPAEPSSDRAQRAYESLAPWLDDDTTRAALAAHLGAIIAMPPEIPGIGPDQPKITGAHGGQQSALPYRFDLFDAKAMFALASILHYGADVRGYPENNWRKISAEENVNHALAHLMAWLANDQTDDHLGHAFCRLMFALGVQLAGGPDRGTQ